MGQSVLWLARDLKETSNLEFLADPDILFTSPECQIVKDERKVKIGRIPLAIEGRLTKIYLKRYNAFSLRYRLSSLFMSSDAYLSWQGAALLRQAGFNVGNPLAAIEYRSFGMLKKSFYLSAEVPGSSAVDAFWDGKSRELDRHRRWSFQKSLIRELAQLFVALHEKSIYHKDLKDANILVQEKDGVRSYYFTDLEDVSIFGRLSWRRKVKNLGQLDRTLGKRLSRGRRLWFLKEYLQQRYDDKVERRRWMAKIIRNGRKADRRYQRNVSPHGRATSRSGGAPDFP
jgi:hypothetical protein